MKPDAAAPVGLHLFVALLSLGTGSLDVVAFLALGDAFASVMTGNLVLLGFALGTWSTEWAVFTGVAVSGYVAGGLVGSVLAQWGPLPQEEEAWPRRLIRAFSLELVLLIGIAVLWLRVSDDPSLVDRLAILGAGAGAMGVQGAAVRVLPIRVSTTYLTGAVTSVMEAVATRRGFSPAERASVVAVLGLIGGAALGALLLGQTRPFGLVMPPACLLLAVGVVVVQRRLAAD